MPSSKQDTVAVACPKCGHRQKEPRTAYSTRCKRCHEHYRVQEALRPAAPAPKVAIATRRIQCFQCGTELEVPVAAESTMCKRCSSHVDLRDYHITQTISKNIRTHGRLVVEERGYLLNTDALAGDAVLKGRVIGKVQATRTLEIHTSARLQGSISAGTLVVPENERFYWGDILRVGGAEIRGELVANVEAEATVILREGARFFGHIQAAGLVMEAGAVFVGEARVIAVGRRESERQVSGKQAAG